MQPATERRTDRAPRVPANVLIELSHDGFDEPFEADSVDVGTGGLAVHAAYLPEVGSRLRCRFTSPADGRPVEAAAEVVWARDSGPHLGRVGMRFVDVDCSSADALRSLIDSGADVATHPDLPAAQPEAQDAGASPDPAPPDTQQDLVQVHAGGTVDEAESEDHHVRLYLDGVPTAVEARIVHHAPERVQVEQELPFLRIGTGLEAHNGTRRRGRIEAVHLRNDEGTPRLVLEVVYDPPQSAGDTLQDAPVASTADASAAPAEAATTPREAPKPAAAEQTPVEAAQPAVAEPARAEPTSAPAGQQVRPRAVPEDDGAAAPAASAAAPVPSPQAGPVDGGPATLVGAARAFASAAVVTLRRMHGRLGPSARRGLQQWRVVRGWLAIAWGWLLAHGRTLAIVLRRRFGPAARDRAHRTRSRLTAFGEVLRARVRRGKEGRASRASRRRTAPPPRGSNVARMQSRPATTDAGSRSSLRRTALWSAVAFVGAGLAVYALTPETEDPAAASVAQGDSAGSGESGTDESAGDGARSVSSGAAEPTHVSAQQARGPETGSFDPAARPHAPGTVPDTSPYGATEQERGETGSSETSSGPELRSSFGATDVPNARSYELQMSQPVEGLRGVADDAGFSVKIPDSLSLDRAGAIASSHPAVERAMILNRGDHAELTVRFADGRSPPYRVVGRGRAIEVQIGQ